MSDNMFIYQIYYDEKSRASLDSDFIPLDNLANERPDWFEFWVIRQYLKTHLLQDNAWYGFFSTKFQAKTGFNARFIKKSINMFGGDVALFSSDWDQLAYFKNQFEQGEAWHPGLTELAQDFLNWANYAINLDEVVSTTQSAAFCNYLVAKPNYWHEWLKLADLFFEYVENNPEHKIANNTSYGSTKNIYPMKTFIQERLSSVILAKGQFEVMGHDRERNSVFERLFTNNLDTRALLQVCDYYKQKYVRTGDPVDLQRYLDTRDEIDYLPNRSMVYK